ncbi:glycosyltransferase family 4 protein [Paraglaciecola aestuariivivens]
MLYEFKENTQNVWRYLCNTLNYKPSNSNIKIGFICGFHGKTGGPIAIAGIANGLSKTFDVSFEVSPLSFFNRLLAPSVKPVKNLDLDKDIYFFDLSADVKQVEKVKSKKKKCILTIHGLRYSAHSLLSKHIDEMLSLADAVHFVGQVQQKSYQLHENDYFIIPNSATPVLKSTSTRNIGVVGNLDIPQKNAALSIKVGLKSQCDQIQLWSTEQQYSANPRVVHHTWESNRNIIFDSFDILVFLSEQETFGLVVAEALSAGIPCILSDIEGFEQFKDCPGVVLVKENDIDNAHLHVNRLLLEKEKLNPAIKAFYQQRFSPEHIDGLWQAKIDELISCQKI